MHLEQIEDDCQLDGVTVGELKNAIWRLREKEDREPEELERFISAFVDDIVRVIVLARLGVDKGAEHGEAVN